MTSDESPDAVPLPAADYGGVWRPATESIAGILESGLAEADCLRKILGLGSFTQLTSYPARAFNEAVVSWLTDHLEQRHGLSIAELPEQLSELDLAPEATRTACGEHYLSPDLLRYVAYAMQLREAGLELNRDTATEVLEIGSGYGGLARVLKCFHPNTRFWLTDLPESLRCADIFLRAAFPELRIVWLDGDGDAPGDIAGADFILVPLAMAPRMLGGRHFDLAINVWSFGEMPNHFVESWLGLIQQDCDVTWLFTINSFMAPVTRASASRTLTGDWLFRLDARWSIEHFEIDPEVHRCPLIRNFPKGIGLIARRDCDQLALQRSRDLAGADATLVHGEDWARIAASERATTDGARPERMLEPLAAPIDMQMLSSRRLTTLTDYIGHFVIDDGMRGPFFRLWNDWRMNQDECSGALLVCYLAMVGKSDVEQRCTKEELLLLNRLAALPLHDEYAAFREGPKSGLVRFEGRFLTDQQACDKASLCKQAGRLAEAEVLWQEVAANYPGHGDCWYQLAQLREMQADLPRAAVFAAHAVRLGCAGYAEQAERMRVAFRKAISPFGRAGLRALFPRRTMPPAGADTKAVRQACRNYFDGQQVLALTTLAGLEQAAGAARNARALHHAAARYQ